MNTKTNLPELRINQDVMLPDNAQWTNRFEIQSESSNNIYVVAQNIKGRFWGCSCPGWRAYRKCKHLDALGIPTHEIPYEPKIITK